MDSGEAVLTRSSEKSWKCKEIKIDIHVIHIVSSYMVALLR